MQIPEVDSSKLVHGPKGLRLEAKVSYREGQAMLTVYGFWVSTIGNGRGRSLRVMLQRVFVPSNTPKAEKHSTLRAMCDLLAVQYETEYYLRSKLQ
jgi:hypothetical protein